MEKGRCVQTVCPYSAILDDLAVEAGAIELRIQSPHKLLDIAGYSKAFASVKLVCLCGWHGVYNHGELLELHNITYRVETGSL